MSAKIIEVIQVIVTKGTGKTDSPIRTFVEYYSKEGQLLASNDPYLMEEDK